jgi:hypothetical protein
MTPTVVLATAVLLLDAVVFPPQTSTRPAEPGASPVDHVPGRALTADRGGARAA